MQSIIQTVKRTIRLHQLPDAPCNILVALSGGADSVCLLLLAKELGYNVQALHCNFHLRGEESERDEQFVSDFCQQQGITLHVKHFDTKTYCKEHGVSIEMGARELRYDWFEEMLTETGSSHIFVAHHQQDQAETLLLNLLRGSGLRGLAAMHYIHGNVVRPLLDTTRQQIEDYLTQRGQTWITDSTNYERDAQRNIIRLDVLPLLQSINPQAVRHIAETASAVQESLPYFESKGNMFEASTLTELYEATRHANFTRTQLTDILDARTGAIIESKSHKLLKHEDVYYLRPLSFKADVPELTYTELDAKEIGMFEKNVAYFDTDKLKMPLTVRTVKEGDRMQPFGMKGSRLLSDMMTDLHLTRFQKEDQHVLVDAEDNILWLIGIRASNLCKLTQTTRKVLKVSIRNHK